MAGGVAPKGRLPFLHDESRPAGKGKAQAKGPTMALHSRFMKALRKVHRCVTVTG